MAVRDGITASNDSSQDGHASQNHAPKNTHPQHPETTLPPPSLEQLAKTMADLQAQMQIAMAQLQNASKPAEGTPETNQSQMKTPTVKEKGLKRRHKRMR